MSLATMELQEVKHTPLDHIVGEYECLYIDQGGTLTYEQQDAMIVKLTTYAKELEEKLANGEQAYPHG